MSEDTKLKEKAINMNDYVDLITRIRGWNVIFSLVTVVNFQ